jgi:hypothetical protein
MEKRGGVVPVIPEDGDVGAEGGSEGETFSFGIDSHSTGTNSLTRQQTSAELLAALSSADLNDQEKIAAFISRLKEGEVAIKKTSEFRKRRLTYEQKTSEKPVPQSAAAKAALEAAGVGGASTATAAVPDKAATRAKRTAIFASSEIGSRQEKKPPFPPHLMGTFSCHGTYVQCIVYNAHPVIWNMQKHNLVAVLDIPYRLVK